MAYNNTVLSQLLKLLPRHEFEMHANRCDGKRRSDALSRWSQFVALTIGQLGGRRSLRDIEATIQSQGRHRYHLGSQTISRSGLSRANERLDYRFFECLFQSLYQRCAHSRRAHGFRFKNKLFSLDASLIDVSMKVFPWATFNRKKSAFKLHVGLDHDGLIPAFASVTRSKVSDMAQARLLALPRSSVVVFDKGYNSYGWHNSLTGKGIFFVSRIRGNAQYRVLKRQPVNKCSGVTSDQIIKYTSPRKDIQLLQQAASINYRIAIGPHAGRKAVTLYSVPPLEEEPSIPLLATMYGFSLHAGTVCEAHQRSKLERLCRYITRPPIATKRLSVDAQGRVVYRYKQAFRDGSTHVVLEPLDFMARLAALVPRPRLNLTRFHGVFAPNFKRRHMVVPRRARGRVDSDKPLAPMSWAQRLKRVFAIDIEACPECGGKLRVIACIEEPALIVKILGHVLVRDAAAGTEARAPPGREEPALQLV